MLMRKPKKLLKKICLIAAESFSLLMTVSTVLNANTLFFDDQHLCKK